MNKQEAIDLLVSCAIFDCTRCNNNYRGCRDKEKFEDMKNTIISELQQLSNGWIPVSERLPENDNPVEITARRKEGARGYFIYKAHYLAPHTKTTEDYGWDSDYTDWGYDEENDCHWIPECWYEDNAISDNGNYILDDEFDILAWRELPEPYKEDKDGK